MFIGAYLLVACLAVGLILARSGPSRPFGVKGFAWILLAGLFWPAGLPIAFLVRIPRPEHGEAEVSKTCLHCGTPYRGLLRYCRACGGQNWEEVVPE